MKACFQIAECSISSAKLMLFFDLSGYTLTKCLVNQEKYLNFAIVIKKE